MKKLQWFLLAFVTATLFSCEPNTPVTPDEFKVGHGVLVLNEGAYQSSSSSLTFYDPDADTVTNGLFLKVNYDLVVTLGDVAQSMALADGKLYIVVNNSNHIYKMDANKIRIDTTKPFKLQHFYSPREMMIVAPNKAYVSDLMGRDLWIVNPLDMTHTGTIAMGKTTEKMVQVGNEIYVSNWSYYYTDPSSSDSYHTVQVVDVNNDIKVAEIEVGKEPNTMVVDKDNHVWVLCEGRSWDMVHFGDPSICEAPTLWEIDPLTKSAYCRYTFASFEEPSSGDMVSYSATTLKSDPSGRYLYAIVSELDQYGRSSNSEVRRFDVETMTWSETYRISANGKTFYNMAVHPQSGEIYVSCISNPSAPGTVCRYSADGVLLSSFEAGLFPSAMLFK